MEELKINQKANEENIKIFKRYGTTNADEKRHTCVLCNRKVSISDSMSDNGSRLICGWCEEKYFDFDFYKARKWIDRR